MDGGEAVDSVIPADAARADVRKPRRASSVPQPAKGRGAARRQRGVLIVEDNPDAQWRLARMLTVRGNRVVGTSTGDGALALIAQWPVDLVLIDEALPGMSGVDLTRRLRALYPKIAVIVMTDAVGEDRARLETRALAAGASACVSKPLAYEAVSNVWQDQPAARSVSAD